MINFLLASLIITIIFAYLFLYLNVRNKKLQKKLNKIKNDIDKQKNNQQIQNILDEQKKQQEIQENNIIQRDYRVVYDPLIPAVQRPAIYNFPPAKIAQYIDIPTRGFPDSYQYLGNLFRKSDEKVIKLFGRLKYPRSDKYDYYGIGSDSANLDYKIPIETRNFKEIYNGDEIDVPYLNVAKGKFKALLFPDQTFSYNPNIL
jgi:hypothetical protein